MGKKHRKVMIWVVIACFALIIGALLIMNKKSEDKEIESAIQDIIVCAEEKGLKDVTIELRKLKGYASYEADITCSNFDDFSPAEMYDIYKSVRLPLMKKIGFLGKRLYIHAGDVYSNGDKYEICTIPKLQSVIKNDMQIYWGEEKPQNAENGGSDPIIASSSEKDSYGHTKYDAIVIAEKEVKASLKSPSTAKFSPSSETSVTRSGNTWRVTGWVDAQNGFGATLRNSYTVKIEFASSDTYTVKECTVS